MAVYKTMFHWIDANQNENVMYLIEEYTYNSKSRQHYGDDFQEFKLAINSSFNFTALKTLQWIYRYYTYKSIRKSVPVAKLSFTLSEFS